MNTSGQIAEKIDKLCVINKTLNAAIRIFDIELNPLSANELPGPLANYVFSVKECFYVKGEPVYLGSAIATPQIPNDDAAIVKQVKKLGASLIARGNLSECMVSYETNNLRYGKTNNPLNHLYTAGGSSGGDAALVASGAVDFAIASDIGGSVRIPSAFCGVVGFKMAANDVSIEGFYPRVNHFAESMLGIGLITQKVSLSRSIYEAVKQIKLSAAFLDAPVEIIALHPFTDGIKNKNIHNAFTAVINYCQKSDAFILKHERVSSSFTMLKQWLYVLADAYSPYLLKSINSNNIPFSLIKEMIRRYKNRPKITKELLIQLLLIKLIKPETEQVNSFIDKIEQQRSLYYQLLNNGIFIMPTCKVLAPLHGKLNKKINLGKFDTITGTIFSNVMNLASITIPAHKYSDKATNLVPAIMLATKPGNEALLFYMAEKLELILN